MTLWDVNLWVYAFRADSPFHSASRDEIDRESRSGRPYLYSPVVAVSFLRLVTNPRVFAQPSEPREAWTFADVLADRPGAVWVDVDPMAWGVFRHLCLTAKSAGNDVPDALLAAIAIRHDATFVTADRRFDRFDGLACRLLEAPPPSPT